MRENLLASRRQSGQKQDPCPSLLNYNAKYKRLLPPFVISPTVSGRLIDSYTEGLIEKPEFEPRIAELRRRLTRLEAEASEQQAAEEQARSLQRVIGKLDLFAAMVRDRLGTADWSTKREIICLLVKRIE